MPLSKEELLIPRYKMIADFPWSSRDNHNVGDIFTDDGKSPVMNQENTPIRAIDWQRFPHLFKELQWWEERKIEDLPEYIKANVHCDEHFFKVYAYVRASDAVVEFAHGDASVPSPWNGWYPFPATEEEYFEFKNSGNEQGGNN